MAKNKSQTTTEGAATAQAPAVDPEPQPQTQGELGIHTVEDTKPAPLPMPDAPAPTKPEPTGVVGEVLALQKKLDESRGSAIKQLLAERTQIEDQLALLGYTEVASTGATTSIRRTVGTSVPRSNTVRKPATANGTSFCKICQLPGHDARSHRGQAVKKKFTPDELKAING